jgi:hypothetical protein
MPSAAFNEWQNVRMSRLAQIDGQCAAIVALVPLAEYRGPPANFAASPPDPGSPRFG